MQCSAFKKAQEIVTDVKYHFTDISEFREQRKKDGKPDLAMYPTKEANPAAARAYELNDVDASAQLKSWQVSDPARHQFLAKVSWAWMVIPVEVKRTSGKSGYYMEPGPVDAPFLRDSEDGRLARAQHSRVIAEIQERQHRTHVFSIYIYRQYARLLRWDRNGVVITDVIDLVKDGIKLLNFVYRTMTMTRGQLGFDETANPADDIDVKSIEAFKAELQNPYLLECLEDILRNRDNYPIYKVCLLYVTSILWLPAEQCFPIQLQCEDVVVPEAADAASRFLPSTDPKTRIRIRSTGSGNFTTYFIGKPCATTFSPTGRGTKGFVAFKPKQDGHDSAMLHFIKDYWRPDTDAVRKELDVYANLKFCDVSHVATAIGGGDVGENQGSLTQGYMQVVAGCPVPLRRVHCRLVLKEVGRPLDTYEDQGVLMGVLYDAVTGK